MHARVATFEGGDPDEARQGVDEINRRAAAGPPEGVPAKSLLVLFNPADGKVLSITLFETEEQLRQGDATLNAMDPPVPGRMGRRTSVEMYEVGVKIEA